MKCGSWISIGTMFFLVYSAMAEVPLPKLAISEAEYRDSKRVPFSRLLEFPPEILDPKVLQLLETDYPAGKAKIRELVLKYPGALYLDLPNVKQAGNPIAIMLIPGEDYDEWINIFGDYILDHIGIQKRDADHHPLPKPVSFFTEIAHSTPSSASSPTVEPHGGPESCLACHGTGAITDVFQPLLEPTVVKMREAHRLTATAVPDSMIFDSKLPQFGAVGLPTRTPDWIRKCAPEPDTLSDDSIGRVVKAMDCASCHSPRSSIAADLPRCSFFSLGSAVETGFMPPGTGFTDHERKAVSWCLGEEERERCSAVSELRMSEPFISQVYAP